MSKKEKFNCAYCGKEIWRETRYKAENHFCNQKCQYAYFHEHYDYIYKNCEVCGKEMKINKHRKKQRFCSLECQREWYSKTMSGENAARFNSVVERCRYCDKEILVSEGRRKRSKYYFCDSKCRQKWFSEVVMQTNEWKNKMSETIVKSMSEGKIHSTMTKPHKDVCNMLDDMGIEYNCEYPIEFYSVDIQLRDSGLMIEVMGDYWHSNPTTKYFLNIDAKRKDIIRRDRSKHTYIKNNNGIEVLYLWEKDIKDNKSLCIQLIKRYIENNGFLQTYDSFNYHIDNEEMCLNDVLIDSNITTNKEINDLNQTSAQSLG